MRRENENHDEELKMWKHFLDEIEEEEKVPESVEEEDIYSLLSSLKDSGAVVTDEGLFIVPSEDNEELVDHLFGMISNIDEYDRIYKNNHDKFIEVDELEAYMQIIKTKVFFKKCVTIESAKKEVKKWLCGSEEDDTLVILWAKRIDVKDNGDYKLLVSYARIPLLIDIIDKNDLDPNENLELDSDYCSTKQIGWDKSAEDVLGFINKLKFKENNDD